MARLTALVAALVAVTYAVPIQNHTCPTGYCAGTNDTGNTTYICNDPRLGPVALPTMLPLSNTVYGYSRFGGLCPGAYLATWYNNSAQSYIYPPDNGAQALANNAGSLNGTITLQPGTYVDRFGRETGRFLAPYGTPYDMRALPPDNLITYTGTYPFNYYVYEVKREIDVVAGVIAGWFEQPGNGVQYYTDRGVDELLRDGVLRRVDLDELV